MSYATPADIQARYDVRRLGDLVRDDGTRATPSQLSSDANLQAALNDADGVVNAAVLQGQRYKVADLQSLTGNDQQFLIRICCDLAYGHLLARRGYTSDEMQKLAPRYTLAIKTLEQLSRGNLVFNVAANLAAGIGVIDTLSSQVSLISGVSRIFGDLNAAEWNDLGNQ
jgi:phage gp36-like protein